MKPLVELELMIHEQHTETPHPGCMEHSFPSPNSVLSSVKWTESNTYQAEFMDVLNEVQSSTYYIGYDKQSGRRIYKFGSDGNTHKKDKGPTLQPESCIYLYLPNISILIEVA